MAAATTYDATLWDWLTVQICAIVLAVAVVISLCLSSLRCVSGSTLSSYASDTQNVPGGSGDYERQSFGTTLDAGIQPEPAPSRLMESRSVSSATQNDSGSSSSLGAAAQSDSDSVSMFKGLELLDQAEQASGDCDRRPIGATSDALKRPELTPTRPMKQTSGEHVDGSQPSGHPLSLPGASVAGKDEQGDDTGSEAESDVALFEEPAPRRTSSTGIFSPPPHSGQSSISQAQTPRSAQHAEESSI